MGLLGNNSRGSFPRLLFAVILGLTGSVFIWVLTPVNNMIIGVSYVCDSYLPFGALLLMLLIVLGLNPLMKRFNPLLALGRHELALTMGIMFMASVLPAQGLLRLLPYFLGYTPMFVRENARMAEMFEQIALPEWLFPDKLGFGLNVPVSEYFVTELPPGATIPWGAWVPPLLGWGVFILFGWFMMVGLALIVLPQWRRNERLSFPLLTVSNTLIDAKRDNGILPGIFRKPPFWIAVGLVFALHLLLGIKEYNPSLVPAIPLSWSLSRLFTEEPLRFLPGHISNNQIYFIYFGVAYFMPNRTGFSIWFFVIAYAIYNVIGQAYFPPFYGNTVNEHRMGAIIALTLAILWIGRYHWIKVFGNIFRKSQNEEQSSDRTNALLFLIGCAGMAIWLIYVGVQPAWALFFVAFGVMLSLIMTRIVAETGMPFIRIDTRAQFIFVQMVPMSWLTPITLYFSYVIVMFFPIASRMSVSTMVAHAIGLHKDATPKRRTNLAWLFIMVLLLSLIVSGAVHLWSAYNNSMALDGTEQLSSRWARGRLNLPNNSLVDWQTGRLNKPVYSQWGHLAFGFVLAALLQFACLRFPKWPLHPIGLLMVNSFFANVAWVSIFLGWLVKNIIVKYGGARLYRSASPIFLGLIVGDVLATVFWGLAPLGLILFDLPYKAIQLQPF